MTTTLTDQIVDTVPIVTGIVRGRLPERDVQDTVQDVLIGLWRHLAANEVVGSPRSLAATIAHRRVIDYWRGANSRVVLSNLLPDLPGADTGPEGPLTLSAQLAELLAPLTDHQRRVLWLRVAEGRTSAEVAAMLGTSPIAIRTVQCRALQQARAVAEGANR